MRRRHSRDDTFRILRRFFSYLVPYRGRFLVVLLLLLTVAALELVRPYLVGAVIDRVTRTQPWSGILWLLAGFSAAVVFKVFATLARNYLLQKTGMRVTCDMRINIFAHLQKLSLRFYDERQTGKIVTRVANDTGAMFSLVSGASVNLIGDLVTVSGVLVVLACTHWKLALVTYCVLPLFLMNFFWHRRRLRVEARRHRRNWDKVIGFLNERIASSRLVRAFATEEIEMNQFNLRIEKDLVNFTRLLWRNGLLGGGAELVTGLGTLVVLGYGSWLAWHHIDGFTVGQLVAFNFYLALLYTPITRIVDANSVIQTAVVALEQIFNVMDTQPAVPENDLLPALPTVRGEVTFDHVSFGYKSHQDTLRDVHFAVAPGKMLALVGPSGAGKSTIITLLARFYEATEGRILIDGRDIRDFNVQSLRRQIGIVMQENILFSGSIRENIKYGKPDATDEEMIEAARAANAHDFIEKFANSYNSEIGERGVTLSGGQRQRIAIARVILKNPRILILDEATSALDSVSERLIQEALERLMSSRTTLVIAHRLSTIVKANEILVMDAGRVVEQGTHATLMAQNGLYATLHSLQFAE
ncbi:MAG: ABC transporter ATP-binding protein [Chthoniobacterales bacterium]